MPKNHGKYEQTSAILPVVLKYLNNFGLFYKLVYIYLVKQIV